MPYLHLHIVFGDPMGGLCVCGLLANARVNATAELCIDLIDGEIGRRFEPAIGLNLFQF